MILQAIKTIYIPPTNLKGSRIKAKTSGGNSITVTWDYSLDAPDNHRRAAIKLMKKMGWNYKLHTGILEDFLSDCYVHVLGDKDGQKKE